MNNSAIPATTYICKDKDCFAFGDKKQCEHGAEHDHAAECDKSYAKCIGCEPVDQEAKIAAKTAEAIAHIKALTPAQQVEVIKDLAQGLDVAVVPREPSDLAGMCETILFQTPQTNHGVPTTDCEKCKGWRNVCDCAEDICPRGLGDEDYCPDRKPCECFDKGWPAKVRIKSQADSQGERNDD